MVGGKRGGGGGGGGSPVVAAVETNSAKRSCPGGWEQSRWIQRDEQSRVIRVGSPGVQWNVADLSLVKRELQRIAKEEGRRISIEIHIPLSSCALVEDADLAEFLKGMAKDGHRVLKLNAGSSKGDWEASSNDAHGYKVIESVVADFPELEELEIANRTDCPNEVLMAAFALDNLKRLRINDCSKLTGEIPLISPTHILKLTSLAQLRSLELSKPAVSEQFFTVLASSPLILENISLEFISPTDRVGRAIVELLDAASGTLQIISLKGLSLNFDGRKSKCKIDFKRLRSLKLERCCLVEEDDSWTQLDFLAPTLTELSLIKGVNPKRLPEWSNRIVELKNLNIFAFDCHSNDFTFKFTECTAMFEKLTSLTVDACADSFIDFLADKIEKNQLECVPPLESLILDSNELHNIKFLPKKLIIVLDALKGTLRNLSLKSVFSRDNEQLGSLLDQLQKMRLEQLNIVNVLRMREVVVLEGRSGMFLNTVQELDIRDCFLNMTHWSQLFAMFPLIRELKWGSVYGEMKINSSLLELIGKRCRNLERLSFDNVIPNKGPKAVARFRKSFKFLFTKLQHSLRKFRWHSLQVADEMFDPDFMDCLNACSQLEFFHWYELAHKCPSLVESASLRLPHFHNCLSKLSATNPRAIFATHTFIASNDTVHFLWDEKRLRGDYSFIV